MVKIAGQHSRESARKRECRLMGKAGKHHVRHYCQLTLYRISDVWMVIAVTRRPPGGNAIDKFASVGELNPTSLCANYRGWSICPLHLRVWQPDMIQPLLVPRGRIIQIPQLT